MKNLLKIAVFAGFLLFLTLEFIHPLDAINQDLGRHLVLGKIILQTLHVPPTNLFSYTYPSFPFINTHWLSEVFFYALVMHIGFQGLLFTMTFIALLAFGIMFWSNTKSTGFFSLGVVCLLSTGILFERTDIRPEIFSFLFLAIFTTILFKNYEKPTKWLFLLPLLEVLWVNIHIYFLFGPLLIGAFVLDQLIVKAIFKHELHSTFSKLLLVLLLTTCAMLLNPHGLSGALYPFFVFQNYGYTIQENQSVFFLANYSFNPTIYFFFASCSLLFIVLGINWQNSKPIDWILALSFSYIGAKEIRNFPVYVIVTFSILVVYFDILLRRFGDFFEIHYKQNLFRLIGILLLLIIAFWEVAYFTAIRPPGVDTHAHAESAVTFLQTNHLHGPIFNNFDIGSYLIYRLYPNEKVFVDGRPEAYPASFFQNTYIPMQEDQKLFEKEDSMYHFNVIFFTISDQTLWGQMFLKDIVHNPSWKIIYLDSSAIILVKNIPQNQPLIKTFGMDQQTVNLADENSYSSRQLLQLAEFFQNAGWIEDAIATLQKLLMRDPHDCTTMQVLGQLYLAQNNSVMVPILAQKYQAYCQ